MAYALTWSPTARLDFRDLVGYIADFDPVAAEKFGQGIFEAVERLPHFPESGRMVPEFNEPTLREIIQKPCRIVYRLKHQEGTIQIVRIWHAARGIPDV